MKKSDLKKIIKPIVKECINEVLIEEGVLSNIVSEVATGLQGNVIAERNIPNVPQSRPTKKTTNVDMSKKLEEQRQKMRDVIGRGAYNGVDLFEGTTPTPAQQESAAGSVDLGESSDSGVDISSLVGDASQIWKAMK